MNNYRWIDYPLDLDAGLRQRYEALADQLLANASGPIAIVWAHPHEDWTDTNGVNPERDCLLVTEHIEVGGGEFTFGRNLSTHKLYMI